MKHEEIVFHCSSCGAELMANSLAYVKCAYCGSVQFAKEIIDYSFIPDAIVQFKNSNDAVLKSLKRFLLLKTKLKRKYEIIAVTPIYIPCDIYNFGVDCYQKYFDSNSGGSEKQIKEIYSIIQDGSNNIDDIYIYSAEPFDFSKMKKFNPIYLNGTYTELNRDNETLQKAVSQVKKSISNKLLFYKGIADCNIYTIDKVQAYLPIWIAIVKSRSGTNTFVMNDTTNKWVTNAPVKTNNFFINIWEDILFIIVYFGMFFIMFDLIKYYSIGRLISEIVLLLVIAILLNSARKKSINNKRKRSREIKDIDVSPVRIVKSTKKAISSNNIIEGKTVNFYLDGKKI